MAANPDFSCSSNASRISFSSLEELEAPMLPPRVVCSSKDACFLCNVFISMHRKMHTPRCHGRLYPGWRLPFSPKLTETERRFNNMLGTHVRSSLTTLIARRKKTIYPDPNESTLLTLPLSTSTLRSLGLLEAVIREEEEPDHSDREDVPIISSKSILLIKSSEITIGISPLTHIGDIFIKTSNDIISQTTLSTIPSY